MRIVIDMQGAQSSDTRSRGIGRYTLSLTKEIVRSRGNHEVFIALNGLFPETVGPIRETFNDLLPQEYIRVWYAPAPVDAMDRRNDARRLVAELLREQFLASLSPDVVLVTSLFEGLSSAVVTSVGSLSSEVPNAVILYDLIPLIYRDIYLQNAVTERCYQNKLGHLRRADLLLSISESGRKEAVDHLGFDERQVYHISAAAEEYFCPADVSDKVRRHLASQYGLVRPFVMYTGGIDHRKNIEGLISAYARLPVNLRRSHQLAVVCSTSQVDRERFYKLASKSGLGENELILTGFLPEEDLLACYRACKTFVFPSLHEGFGLPALEAMRCGKSVIASNTSSLPEVIGRADALFDPCETNAITGKMMQVLSDDTFRKELEHHGLKQAEKFSWNHCARRVWKAFVHGFSPNKHQRIDVSATSGLCVTTTT